MDVNPDSLLTERRSERSRLFSKVFLSFSLMHLYKYEAGLSADFSFSRLSVMKTPERCVYLLWFRCSGRVRTLSDVVLFGWDERKRASVFWWDVSVDDIGLRLNDVC